MLSYNIRFIMQYAADAHGPKSTCGIPPCSPPSRPLACGSVNTTGVTADDITYCVDRIP